VQIFVVDLVIMLISVVRGEIRCRCPELLHGQSPKRKGVLSS